jgi:hypothetical protein
MGQKDEMCARIDSRGRIRMIDVLHQKMSDQVYIPDGSPEKKKIRKVDGEFISQEQACQSKYKDSYLENCWICEGWLETEFSLNLPQLLKTLYDEELVMSDDHKEVKYHVYMHFEFDDYAPDRLDDLRAKGKKGEFHTYKMVP